MASRKEMVNAGSMLTESIGINGSFDYNVAATGSTQATAYQIKASNTVVKTVTGGSADGVILLSGDQGDWVQIFNYSAATLKVYPPIGWAIHGGTVNNPVSISAGKTGQFTQMTDTLKGSLPAGFAQHEYAFCLSA